jgi:putative ABC transport system permease protein
VLKKTESNVAATAKLYHYQEITEQNIDSFHFHGNLSAYPVTAVIVVPQDTKSGTLLQGRYLHKDEIHQIVEPQEVIEGLLQNIFRIKNVLDTVISIVAIATIMAIVLVFALSLRLRQREIQTIFKLGCRRATVVRLVSAEILIIVLTSGILSSGMVFLVNLYSNELVRRLVIR